MCKILLGVIGDRTKRGIMITPGLAWQLDLTCGFGGTPISGRVTYIVNGSDVHRSTAVLYRVTTVGSEVFLNVDILRNGMDKAYRANREQYKTEIDLILNSYSVPVGVEVTITKK